MKNLVIKSWPLLFLFAVWFVFASPYLLKGKIPFPSTYQVSFFAPWSAYGLYTGAVKNNAMPDVVSQMYPWRHFSVEGLKEGFIPFWNPYSFAGTPHLANYQSSVFSPMNGLFFMFSFVSGWSLLVLLQPFLAGIFMYFYVGSLRVSKIGRILSSLSFMFCGFLVVWMGYGTLGYAILFLPLALFAIERFSMLRGSLYWLFVLSFTLPLSFFSGHFQTSLYFLLAVLAYIFYSFFVTRNVRAFLFSLLSVLLGILLVMPQVLPSLEFYSQSLRSVLFQKGEVIPWSYLPTFLAPDFLGNPVTRNDWFGHYAEWNGYIGVLPFLLAVYSVMRTIAEKLYLSKRTFLHRGNAAFERLWYSFSRVRFCFDKDRRPVLFFGGLALISLLLAFQTPLLDVMIALRIPVLSTSAVSRIIVLFSFSMAVLAGIGFDFIFDDVFAKRSCLLFFWLFSFLFIFILLWVVVIARVGLSVDHAFIAKQNLLLPSIIFFIFSLALLFVFFFSGRKKLLFSLFSMFLVIIVAFDMLRFSMKWQSFDPGQFIFSPVGVTQYFQNRYSPDRVLGNYGGELPVYYRMSSLEGYDALYIKRYGEFVWYVDQGVPGESYRSLVNFPKKGKYTNEAVNLLGVKYIVHKLSDGRVAWTFPFWLYPDTYKLVYSDAAYQVYKNLAAFPRAFLVGSYVVRKDDEKNLSTLFSSSFNRKSEVVLEKDPHVTLNAQVSSRASILSYQPNKVVIQTSSKGSKVLFLSDSYYPGWTATIDGKSTEILRADYAFRGVVVPAGNHIVVFSYLPESFIVGVWCFLGGLGGLLSLFFLFQRKPLFNGIKR